MTMGKNTSIPAIAERAAALIEEYGWWNGKGSDIFPSQNRAEWRITGICAAMAIAMASDELSGNERYSVTVLSKFSEFLNVPWIPHWNDKQTSGEPVIAALRAFALIYRAQHGDAAPTDAPVVVSVVQPNFTYLAPLSLPTISSEDWGATVKVFAGDLVVA